MGMNGISGYPPPSSVQRARDLNQLSMRLTNLKKFTQYSVVVQAYNRVGAGPRNEEIVVTTDEDGE